MKLCRCGHAETLHGDFHEGCSYCGCTWSSRLAKALDWTDKVDGPQYCLRCGSPQPANHDCGRDKKKNG